MTQPARWYVPFLTLTFVLALGTLVACSKEQTEPVSQPKREEDVKPSSSTQGALRGKDKAHRAAMIGVYRPSDRTFYLRTGNPKGPADLLIPCGADGDLPVVGDWTGDGITKVGVYHPSDRTFYLRTGNPKGPADLLIPYGADGDLPIVGDWTGDGITKVGVYRPSDRTFYLRTGNPKGPADIVIPYGATGDLPVTGIWSGL